MTRLAVCLAALSCLAVAHAPARADSLVSSASSAGSQSLGSSSDSSRASSDSSRRDNDDQRNKAEGDYKVIEVADVADRAGFVHLRLQPAAHDGRRGVSLELPRRALGETGMASGDIVSAQPRPYGTEFARAATKEPFFLLLTDDWYRELQAHAVTAATR